MNKILFFVLFFVIYLISCNNNENQYLTIVVFPKATVNQNSDSNNAVIYYIYPQIKQYMDADKALITWLVKNYGYYAQGTLTINTDSIFFKPTSFEKYTESSGVINLNGNSLISVPFSDIKSAELLPSSLNFKIQMLRLHTVHGSLDFNFTWVDTWSDALKKIPTQALQQVNENIK